MSSAIYSACDVVPVLSSPGNLTALADDYTTLSTTADNARLELNSVVTYVQSLNDGPTVDAFSDRMTGDGSADHQLGLITKAARKTAMGYQVAAAAVASTRAAMDAVTLHAQSAIVKAMLKNPFDFRTRALILRWAKQTLNQLENSGVATVNSALAVSAPATIDVGAQRPGESVTPEVAEMWEQLSDDQKLEILKLLVEEYAREHGIDPPPEIEVFYPKPGSKEENWGGYWDGNKVHINGNNVDSPIAMNIIIHETQHAVQSTIADKYNNLSEQERQDMREGRIPDVFSQHGSSIEEATRLAEAEEYYTNEGPRYPRAPKETDAGRAVYEWSDKLTEEKMQEYIDAVS